MANVLSTATGDGMTLNCLTPHGLLRSPDDHLRVLRTMLRSSMRTAKEWRAEGSEDGILAARRCEHRAEAINWILSETSWGVTEDEVVT